MPTSTPIPNPGPQAAAKNDTPPAAAPKPPARRGRGRTGARSAGTWQPVVDAAYAVGAKFSDPNAVETMSVLDTAADAIEALAQAFSAVGQTALDSVYIDPRVAPYLSELGKYVRGAVEPTREGAEAVKRAHQEDLDKIAENDPRKAKWDISKNN
jgi:hypothetical protein